MDTEMSAQLEMLIPKSLDDIVRRNRDKVEIRIASDKEIKVLCASIEQGPIKNRIEKWYFINLYVKPLNKCQITLIGYIVDSGYPWITSEVERIDLESGLVFTKSGSYYSLEGPGGEGEPSVDLLTTICSALHTWGSGDFLGAPRWFI